MNVWCSFSTIFKPRRVLQIAGLLTLCVAFITMLFFNVLSAHAAPGVNKTISFQGRLLSKSNTPVPEGYYNIEFKIYQGGSGLDAGNTDGTLKWTETHINDGDPNGVHVKNGYFSVDLGALTPFGSNIDWNDDTLWLSMNVAGSSLLCEDFGTAPCIDDGEMLPMKRLTAAPYALNSAKLEGKSASDFVQNTTELQTGNFNLSGLGMANRLQGNTSVLAPLFDTTEEADGLLQIGTTNAYQIDIGTNRYGTRSINIGTGEEGIKEVAIGSMSSISSTTIQGGGLGVSIATTGTFTLEATQTGINSLTVEHNGDVTIGLPSSATLNVRNALNRSVFSVTNDTVATDMYSLLEVRGDATFNKGITIQGSTIYTTPTGFNMSTAISIPNYQVGNFGSVFAFGLPANSSSTARGMIVADARTTSHQSTIGVLSPDETQLLGLNWDGSNEVGRLASTGDKLALQGHGIDLLTVKNSYGVANVGIGNNAEGGYALDVTGGVNASDAYSINGVSVLNNSGLNFSGSGTSTIGAASGEVLQLSGDGGVRIGDGTDNGEPTLLTLDKSDTAPLATGETFLGSMYYDTTLGKLQCYEADGWGACSSSPDNFVTLSPEYTNAVTNGAGTGDMTSDICSDTLNINDGSSSQPAICGTNETYNFYQWTTSQTSAQTKDIYVTYQLPSNFTGFVEGSTSLVGRTDDDAADVSYRVYKNTASGLVPCGSSVQVSTGVQSAWRKIAASGGADPYNCSFAPNDSIVFRISLTSEFTTQATHAYASTLSFAFSDN